MSFLLVAKATGGRLIEDLSWSTSIIMRRVAHDILHAWERVSTQLNDFVYSFVLNFIYTFLRFSVWAVTMNQLGTPRETLASIISSVSSCDF